MAFNLFSGDPQQQAMLALASGMLESGGPSRMPVGLGQGAARGMMQGREAFMSAQEAQQRQQLVEQKKKFFELQMQQHEAARAQEAQRQAAIAQLSQDPRFAGMGSLLQVDPQAAIKQAYPEAKVVAPGASLVAPNRPQSPLFTAPEKKPQPSYAESDLTPAQAREFAERKAKASATNVTQTVGAREADKKFAEEFIPFATGGFADTQIQVAQLREVSSALRAVAKGKSDKSLTGPVVGSLPDWLKPIAAPDSQAAQDAVEEVVQRNLRLILGAQFTEKEGARLIARAYNPKLGEAENAKRVDRLIEQIEQAAQAKLDASRYFMANGTLDGWQGKLWSMSDFNPEGGGGGAPKKGDVVDGWEFVGGDPSNKMNWRKK